MTGRIVKLIHDDYTVFADTIYDCKIRGKIRHLKCKLMVGDMVEFDPKDKIINRVLPRKNQLIRPLICNIDQAVIVTSFYPEFDSMLLDKLLVLISYHNIKPIICFSKLDQIDSVDECLRIMDYYRKIGYSVFKNTEIDQIKTIFKNKITVFTGQTGAGKSTLLNKIDPNLTLQTGEISEALGRGKHTTRYVELLQTEQGWIADTPGFSSFELLDMKPMDIRDQFIEFNHHRDQCQYRDCMHDKEDHCIIKDKVASFKIMPSRYENYLKMIRGR